MAFAPAPAGVLRVHALLHRLDGRGADTILVAPAAVYVDAQRVAVLDRDDLGVPEEALGTALAGPEARRAVPGLCGRSGEGGQQGGGQGEEDGAAHRAT